MRLLFAITEPYLPGVIGGGVFDIHDMTLQLLGRGHELEVIAGSSPGARLFVTRLCRLLTLKRLVSLSDRTNGYVTRRAVPWLVSQLLRGDRKW
jgi:hypothetical protein